jgi:hypothetical protein
MSDRFHSALVFMQGHVFYQDLLFDRGIKESLRKANDKGSPLDLIQLV